MRFRAGPIVLAYPLLWVASAMIPSGALVPDELEHTHDYRPCGFLDARGAGGWPSIVYTRMTLVP